VRGRIIVQPRPQSGLPAELVAHATSLLGDLPINQKWNPKRCDIWGLVGAAVTRWQLNARVRRTSL